MIDMLDLISGHKLPVIWALRYANHWLSDTNMVDVVRILVLQALQLNASFVFERPHSLARTGGNFQSTFLGFLPLPRPRRETQQRFQEQRIAKCPVPSEESGT